MAKAQKVPSLREIVLRNEKNRKKTKSDVNKNTFNQYWPQIDELLSEGRSLRSIWNALKSMGIEMSYSVLWKYVVKERGPLRTLVVSPGWENEKAG